MLNEGQAKAVNSDAKQILCLAGAGTGKALLNGTGVFTPNGYKPIETLSVGDLVFASNGLAYPVTGVYPQGKKRVYEVIFNNKVSIKCSIDHLWFYQTASQRGHKKGFKVGSLKEISKYPIRLKSGKFYKNNIYIPLTKPLQFDLNEELPLDPYLLGYLIANGCMANNYSLTVSTIHKDVLSYITECVKKYDCRITTIEPDLTYGIRGNTQNYNQIINILRSLNLMEHTASTKFIPKQYLYTSVQNRLSLLQGLFDGDGCNIKNANEYSTSSSQLAQDIQFLCETLGMTVTTSTKNPKYIYKGEKKSGLTSYRLMIKTTKEMINIFRGSHHINRLKKQQCYARKYIKSIKDLGYESEMTCISVASPDESFLTEHCIVTHNTHCMISRISRLVDEGVDVSNMLVLTFTNAAAREMKERYIKLHPGTTTPKFCTFHAFCYSLIARDSNIRLSTGYKSNVIPNIPSDEELRKIETMCKKQCGVKMSDEKLKGKQPLTKQEQFFYDIYWKHYNKLMRMNNYITFDIMCNDVCRLFNENSPYVDTYKRQYTYIFVDEFQDTDPLQWKFVSSFKDANKFVVGDAKQNIYSFRGTDSSIIKSLAESDDWETIKLSQNYRSTKPICDFSNEIHKTWSGAAYNLAINSDKPGCNVVIKDEFQFEGKDAVSQLFTMFDLSTSETSYALLCRTNAEVAQVKNLLKQANIPFRTNNDGKYVAGILKSAVDSTYMVNWLSGKLSSSEYNNYIRLCACDPYYETEEGFMSEYGQRVTRYSQDIFAVRTILDSDTFPQQKCIDIGKILHLPSTVIELEDQTNAAVVDYLLKEIESSRVEANIYVGTIHSVKGLEFDIVHLLGVNGKSFPLTKEAQLNLYYVGCTRAKHELYVWMSNCV